MIQICRKDKEKVYEAIRSGVRHFLLPKNFLKPYFRLIILSNFPYFMLYVLYVYDIMVMR